MELPGGNFNNNAHPLQVVVLETEERDAGAARAGGAFCADALAPPAAACPTEFSLCVYASVYFERRPAAGPRRLPCVLLWSACLSPPWNNNQLNTLALGKHGARVAIPMGPERPLRPNSVERSVFRRRARLEFNPIGRAHFRHLQCVNGRWAPASNYALC